MTKRFLVALPGLTLSCVLGTALAADMASPPNSLVVDDNGNVGVGTTSPTAPLHLERDDDTAKVFVEDTGTGPNQALMHIKKATNAPFFRYESQFGWWDFSAGFFFVINDPDDAIIEMTVEKSGDMTISGTLTQTSSRDSKHNLTPVDVEAVLDKVLALPLSRWTYTDDTDQARHLGPMSEDFHAVFGLGKNDRGISTMDTSGVALAAIQALSAEIDSLREKNRLLEQEGELLRRGNETLEARLYALERTVSHRDGAVGHNAVSAHQTQ